MLPELWGGSADLAESNNTTIEGAPSFIPTQPVDRTSGRATPTAAMLHFGIREHAMGAILNGIVLHGPTRAVRRHVPDLQRLHAPRGPPRRADEASPSIYVWTHDSIALGEDGPTHQPIEQLAALRAIPGLDVVRPADANETAVRLAGRSCERHDGPAGIALTRQNIPVFERGDGDGIRRRLRLGRRRRQGRATSWPRPPDGTPDVILIATGSEVQLAVAARETLAGRGHQRPRRLGAVPGVVRRAGRRPTASRCCPPAVKARVSVEAGVALGWRGIVGDAGRSVSIEHFGASADYKTLFREFGITAEAVVAAAKRDHRRRIA